MNYLYNNNYIQETKPVEEKKNGNNDTEDNEDFDEDSEDNDKSKRNKGNNNYLPSTNKNSSYKAMLVSIKYIIINHLIHLIYSDIYLYKEKKHKIFN